jgi:hypothetical protein
MLHISVALASGIVLLLASVSPAACYWATDSSWTDARTTFYGRDAWSVNTGSCGFGFICPNRWSGELAQGYDVTAVSDKSDLYGHCGECLEVKCRSASIPDGSGGTLDRKGLCLNNKSVKVKIVDTCPCNYPANAESNKRWCCGDFPHLDLSQWALEKIADDTSRWGVFAISYRRLNCDQDLGSQAAPAFAGAAPDPHANLKPAGLDCGVAQPNTGRKAVATSTPTPAPTASSSGSNNRAYWRQWWHTTAENYDAAKRKRYYKMIWDRIRAGTLTRQGHGI